MKPRPASVDAYIAASAAFAQPILTQLRAWVHADCPDVVEALKWGMPFFVYRQRNLGHMAAFTAHAAFGFWDHIRVVGEEAPSGGMGSLGRLTSLRDLPSRRQFRAWMRAAVAVIDSGAPASAGRKRAAPASEAPLPADLAAGLRRSAVARRHFAAFAPGQRREYVQWLEQAKRAPTREKRLAQALEWIAEGRTRHWKYRA